jgi:PAS domain S-box-containing protein
LSFTDVKDLDLLKAPEKQQPLESILALDELFLRRSKPENYRAEAEALVELADTLSAHPGEMFEKVSSVAMRLTGAHSAGVSLEETAEGKEVFRWYGLVGSLAKFNGGTMPRYFCPCGVVVDEEAPQLMREIIKHFQYVESLEIPVHEVLLAPFKQGGKTIGTVWVVSHTAGKKFDREDLRVLTSISNFAGPAVQAAKERESRKMSTTLAELESAKFGQILQQAPLPLALFEGPEHRFRFANALYQQYFLRGEYRGRKIADVMSQSQRKIFVDNLDRVYRTGVPFVGNEIFFESVTDEDIATRYYLNFVYEPIKNLEGRIEGVLAAVTDVTEQVELRKKIELAARDLANEQHKLESIFQESPAAMVLWAGEDLVFEKVNPQYSKIFNDRELLGKTIVDGIPEVVTESVLKDLKKVFETGEPLVGREILEKIPREDGKGLKDAYFNSTCIRINDVDGKPMGVYEHSVDVTDRVLSRRHLELAKLEAEKANELKSAFLANMSHEIRTPIGAMLGFADLLRDPDLTSRERQNFLDVLSRNGESLAVILNDILDLSKVEAGRLVVEYRDSNPAETVQDVVSLLTMTAKDKGIRLGCSIDLTTPRTVVTDPTRLRQVFINLVGNAIKFTNRGSVEVKTSGQKNAAGNAILRIEVKDSGVGIPEDQLENIFAMFVQADGTTTRRFGGTGLGLALSRKLARALGGDVVISESQLAKGSTFVFTVEDQPQKRSEFSAWSCKSKTEVKQNALDGIKVLVVDDSEDNQELIFQFLNNHGATIDSASNGLAGYKKALAGDHDVVLMDIQMPEMDGYTATHKLRAAGYMKPIVALTAHAMTEARQKCMNVGCTTYLSKPINYKELVATVSELSH